MRLREVELVLGGEVVFGFGNGVLLGLLVVLLELGDQVLMLLLLLFEKLIVALVLRLELGLRVAQALV